MRRAILFEGNLCKVAMSMGAVMGPTEPTPVTEAEVLMAQADRALYASKRAGRGRLTFMRADGTLEELAEGARVGD